MKLFAYHTALCLALLPLCVVALPTDATGKSLSADATMESVNSILDDIRDDEIVRSKRAGSGGFDLLGGLKSQIASIVSKASASLASSSSGSSSGSSSSHDQHHVDVEHFDAHHLKASILNTIFQAVKAITGGITAINGQLIKGSGYAISAGGALVAKSGDAVSNVGKKLALSAELVEPHSHKYPSTGSGGGSGAGIHATLAKLISGSSGASSGSSSGHKEVEQHGHVEVDFIPAKSSLHSQLTKLITSASSSSSSSSASASASSSAKGSSGHKTAEGHGYATYDGHTGAQQYGPAPSGPSATGAAYLPFDHPTSSGHEQSYRGQQTYAGHGEVSTTDILTDSYQRPLTTDGLLDIKSQAVHSAADALRLILDKLPIDKPESTDYTNDGAHNGNSLEHGPVQLVSDLHTPFQPYDIPQDPQPNPPPFRPLPPALGHSSDSSAHSPSINTITHTQIITTAYGAPATDPAQKPVTLFDIETDQWQNVPIGPGVSQPTGGSADHNLYHVMSLKNHGTSGNSLSLTVPSTQQLPPIATYIPAPPSSPSSVSPSSSSSVTSHEQSAVVVSQEVHHHHHLQQQHQQLQHYQQHQHAQQQLPPFDIQQQLLPHYGPPPTVQHLPHVFGPNSVGPAYEIHKSIAYELRGPTPPPPHVQYGQRRLYKVKRPMRRH